MAAAFRKLRVGHRTKKISLRSPQLGLELLEERCTPAVHNWTGTAGDGLWSDAGNWDASGVPSATETGIVLNFGAATGTQALFDDIAGLNVDQINFSTTGYSLTGGTAGGIVLGITGVSATGILDSVGGTSILATSGFTISLAASTNIEVDAGVDTIAAPISGTGFGITKAGAGTLVVSGASSYTGVASVAAGILKLGAAASSGNSPLGTIAGGTVVASGAELDLGGINLGQAEPLTISGAGIGASGGALVDSSTTAATFTGPLTLGAAATIFATGNVVLTSTTGITGTGFGLTLGGTATGSTLVSPLNTSTGGTLTKTGTGTWIVSGSSNFTGATTISTGILKLGAAGTSPNSPLGTTGTGTTVASGATLDLNGITLAVAEPLKISGGGAASTTAGALLNSGAAATYSGLLTLGANAVISSGAAAADNIVLSNTGSITGAFTLTLAGVGNASSIASIIATGVGGVTKVGSGQTYSAGTISQNGTTTSIVGSGTAFTTAMTGGTIVYSDGTTATVTYVSATSLTSAIDKSVPAGSTYTIVYGGKWILGGNSSFTGPVSVQAGILAAGGIFGTPNGVFGQQNTTASLSVSHIVVSSGGTIDINGTTNSSAPALAYGISINGNGSAGQGAITDTGATTGSLTSQDACFPNILLMGNASIGSTNGSIEIEAEGWKSGAGTTISLAGFTLSKTGTDSVRFVNTTVVGGTSSSGTAGIMNLQGGAWVIESGLGYNTGFSNFVNASTAAWIVPTAANDVNASGTGIFVQGLPMSMGSLSGGDTANGGTQDGYIYETTGTLTVGYLGTNTTYGGEMYAGAGNLVKVGGGSLTLTGANLITGALTIQQGTLVAANPAAITSFASMTIGDSTNGTFPAILDSTANYTYSHAITVVGPSTNTDTIQDDGGTVTYSGALTIAGAGDTLTLNQNSTVVGNLQFNGALTSTTTGNVVVSNGGGVAGGNGQVGSDATLVFFGSVNVTGSFSDNQNATGPATATTDVGFTNSGGTLAGLLGANISAVNLGATTSPIVFNGNNSYPAVTNVTAGTVTVTGDESAANGGWNISQSNGTAAESVNFAAGSTVSVGTSAAILVGIAGQGSVAALVANGTINNSGSLLIQRDGQVTDGGVWTQSGAMLVEPTGGLTANMNILAGGSFTYSNTTLATASTTPLIQIAPASASSGLGSLTIAGSFTTNQGFSDPVAASTGSAGVTLVGGTLSFTSNVPTLVATAGSPFNFVLGTNGTLGSTISISSGLAVSANNSISGTGGLAEVGGGTLTLGGPAVDTFTGGISVTGTLDLDNTGLPTATDLINNSNALTLSSGAVNLIGSATGTTSQTIANLSLAPLTTNSISINPNGGTSTTLSIAGAVVSGGPTSALNINYASGTTNGSTVGNDIVAWNPTLTSGLIGGGYTVTDSGGTGYATVVNGDVVRLATSNPLPTSAGDPTQNYLVNSSFSTINPAVPGSLVEALVGPVAVNSVTVDTTSTASGFNLALGSNTLSLGTGMTFGGYNPYTITSASSTAGILSTLSAAAIIFNNYDSARVTIAAPILDNSATSVTLNGPGTTVFSGNNQYSGTTTLSTGASLQIADPGSLGSGNYAGNITDNGSIEDSSGVQQTLAGSISGSGGLTKDGTTSTLTLAGANTYTGPTVLKNGTIAVNNPTAITSSSGITLGDPTATAGSVTLSGNAAYTYSSPITVVGASQSNTILTNGNDSFGGAITLVGGSTLTLSAGGGNLADTGNGSGAGNLVLASTGAAQTTLSGSSWNIGGTIVNNGAGFGTVSISSVLGASITGVQQNSTSSELILSGANVFNSGTTINAGILEVGTSASLSNAGPTTAINSSPAGEGLLTIGANGTLDLSGSSIANAGLTGNGTIGSSAGGATPVAKLTIVSGATPQTFAGTVIAGFQGGTKPVAIGLVGTGSVTFTNGASTYTGGTSIGSGTFIVNTSTTGTPGALTSGPLGTGTIGFGAAASGGTLSISGALTIGNALSFSATPTTGSNVLLSGTDNNVVVSGAISLSGNATITQAANTGTNALTVSGAVASTAAGTETLTFSGPGSNILVSSAIGTGTGTVAATIASGNVAFTGNSTYVGATNINSGAVLTINGKTSGTSAVNVSAGAVLAGTGTIAGGVGSGSVVVNGALDPGGVGAVGKLTVGSLSFGIGGVLNVDLGATTSDMVSVTGNANLANGALTIASTSLPIGSMATIIQTTGTLSGTFSGLGNGAPISLSSGLYEVGYTSNSVTLTFVQPPIFTSPNSATFTIGVSNSFVLMSTGTPTIKYSLSSGTLPPGLTFSAGTLSGTAAATIGTSPVLSTAGSYPLIFTASNGGSTDQPFALNIFGFANLIPATPNATPTVTFSIGSPALFTLMTAGSSVPVTGISLSAGTLPNGLTFSNGTFGGSPLAGTAGGNYTLTADAKDGVDTDATETFSIVILPASTEYVSSSNFGQALAPNIGNTVDGDEGTAGTQTAIFGGNAFSSIAGALSNVSFAGTILVNAGTYPESANLAYSGLFQLSGGTVSVTSLDSSSGTTIDLQSSTLSTGDSVMDHTLNGNILGAGGGSLIKVGSDALALFGTDTYTGPTTVSAGSLFVNGSLVSSVTVDSGALVGGTGTISGAVSVAAGGSIDAGPPNPSNPMNTINTGTLNTGNLSLTTGSTFDARIIGTSPGYNYDQINVTGSVNLDALSSGGATLNVSLDNSFVPSANSVYEIIDNNGSGAVTGLFQTPGGVTLHNGDPFTVGTTNFRIYYTGGDGNDVVLVEASTPPVVYVSNTNFGLSASPVVGQTVDGDLGTGGTQAATFGLNAFSSISGALSAVASGGSVLLNAGTYAESPNLTNGLTLALSGGPVTLNSIDSAAGTTINLQQGIQLTTGVATGSDTVAGLITGSGGLTKVGSDTLVLTDAETYQGGTTVSAGSLLVDGSLSSSSTVSVAANGILAGTGSIAGTISSAGIVSPGDTAGATATLSVGSLTLGAGSLNIDLTSAAAYDSVVSTGAVNLSGASLNLSAVLGNINDNDSFTILSGTSVSGAFNGGSTVTVGSREFSITYNPTNVVLTALPGTAPTVVSTVLNGGISYINSTVASHQHSMVENVVYSFSSAVSLTTSNFTLTGINGTTSAPNVALASSNGGTVWTVTFTGTGVNNATQSIGDGEYALVLSGAGLATSTFDFFRLLGDMDGNGTVDSSDFGIFISSFLRSTTDPLYLGADDFDGNNTVDSSDFGIFVSNFLHSLPGTTSLH